MTRDRYQNPSSQMLNEVPVDIGYHLCIVREFADDYTPVRIHKKCPPPCILAVKEHGIADEKVPELHLQLNGMWQFSLKKQLLMGFQPVNRPFL